MRWLWIGLMGCTVSERALPGKLADVTCDQAFECYEDEVEEFYDSKKDCREDLESEFEDLIEWSEDCEYDGGNAYKCLKAMRAADCGDDALEVDEPACDEIWDCDES